MCPELINLTDHVNSRYEENLVKMKNRLKLYFITRLQGNIKIRQWENEFKKNKIFLQNNTELKVG